MWDSPRQLGGAISYEDYIRFHFGCDEEKRYEWIFSLGFEDLFRIYHFLQDLARYDPEKTIPLPPNTTNSMLFFNPAIVPDIFSQEEIAYEAALLRKHLFS